MKFARLSNLRILPENNYLIVLKILFQRIPVSGSLLNHPSIRHRSSATQDDIDLFFGGGHRKIIHKMKSFDVAANGSVEIAVILSSLRRIEG